MLSGSLQPNGKMPRETRFPEKTSLGKSLNNRDSECLTRDTPSADLDPILAAANPQSVRWLQLTAFQTAKTHTPLDSEICYLLLQAVIG